MEKQRPKVGVGVIIRKDGKVLLLKRKSHTNGGGKRGFIGGHLEFGESIEECAIREVEEETGIQIKNLSLDTFTNDIFEDAQGQKHYISIYISCDYDNGEILIKEVDNFDSLERFARDNLPSPLFKPLENLLEQNYNPFKKVQ